MGRLHRVVRHRQSDSANSDHGSWCAKSDALDAVRAAREALGHDRPAIPAAAVSGRPCGRC
jgi:hypothetical protein